MNRDGTDLAEATGHAAPRQWPSAEASEAVALPVKEADTGPLALEPSQLVGGEPGGGMQPDLGLDAPKTGGLSYEGALRFLRQGPLVGADGQSYKAFKLGLRQPKHAEAWRDVALAYLVLAGLVAAIGLAHLGPWWVALGAGLLGAPAIGMALNFLIMFFHEGAHGLMHPDPKWNDRLVNLLVGAWMMQDVRRYRPIHFAHHRHLGTPLDTERNYFEHLNGGLVLRMLTGVRAFGALRDRATAAALGPTSEAIAKAQHEAGFPWPWLVGVGYHLSVLALAAAMGWWALAFAWVAGLLAWFPFFAGLRQLLEHRDEAARHDVNYAQEAHGALARIFRPGPLTRILGSAGFDRHLLHHLEPQISCTRLAELESFLRGTELGPFLEANTTSYPAAFQALYGPRATEASRP